MGGGGESACTPDSVPGTAGPVAAIHLGRRLPDGSSGLPGGVEVTGGPPSPCLGLAPGGVCRAARVTPGAGALLPHRFTLTCAPARCDRPPSAVCSLLHCPAGRPDWVLPSTLPCGVRTFLGRVEPVRARPARGRHGRLTTRSRPLSHLGRRRPDDACSGAKPSPPAARARARAPKHAAEHAERGGDHEVAEAAGRRVNTGACP